MLDVAAVDGDGARLAGVVGQLARIPELRLLAAVPTVDALLAGPGRDADVVLLGDGDQVGPCAEAGLKVLVVGAAADHDGVLASFRAGAAGYLVAGGEPATLAAAVGAVAAGGSWCSPEELARAWLRDLRSSRPALSEQERAVLVGYTSGLTLYAAARRANVRPGTAKEYLDRVKDKYRRAGRPATTKLELATRVHEDGLS